MAICLENREIRWEPSEILGCTQEATYVGVSVSMLAKWEPSNPERAAP